ncbi:MAG: transcription termination factor NusA [Bdellovibrionales bacterium]|nr:transcription termination factor NusA [Bdellovibrionales bacterium]
MLSDLNRLIEQVSKDKGIEKRIIMDAVLQGLLTAARKKYGTYRDIEAKFNDETGEMELFEFKTVVDDEEFVDDQIEIKYSEALKLDPEAQKNDQIGLRLETKELGRIDAQTARQIISQSIRSAEHEMIFNEFEKRKGEVVSGIVRRVERGSIVVDLDKTEAYIPRKEQIPGERYKPGDRIQGYILTVEQTGRGPQIIMSRAHPEYLIKLFETEVPEIYEGIVKIKRAAREAGQRAKIAVYSLDSAVHPVGACVGMKGTRVQNITQELKGERIDVVIWDENPVQFVCNALAPAKISKVFVDEESSAMEVIVPDDQLSLAIGKKGQNVRLAVQISQWHLDILSEQEYENKKREALFNLSLLPNVGDAQAQSIFQSGVNSVQELQDLDIKKAQSIPGYESEEKAQALIQSAKQLVQEYKQQNKEFEKAPTLEQEIQEKKQLGARAQADLRLKREMERLEKDSDPVNNQEEQPVDADAPVKKEAESAVQASPSDSSLEKEETSSVDENQKSKPEQETE